MNCKKIRELFSKRETEFLSDSEQASLTEHVSACEKCQKENISWKKFGRTWRTRLRILECFKKSFDEYDELSEEEKEEIEESSRRTTEKLMQHFCK